VTTVGEPKTLKIFDVTAREIVKKYAYTARLFQVLEPGSNLKEEWVSVIMAESRSSSFDVANKFSSNARNIDSHIKDLINAEIAFRIIVNVCVAADIGAYDAMDLRGNYFRSTPNLRDLALEFAAHYPKEALDLIVADDVEGTLESFIKRYLTEAD
jgi:hypothetical protein